MVDLESNGIPNLRNNLPLIYQSWIVSLEKHSYF